MKTMPRSPGRPKGSKDKRTLGIEMIAAKFNLDPFEVLMMISNGDWKGLGFEEKTKITYTMNGIEVEEENVPLAQRCAAAKEAARYLYSQKHNVQMSTPEGASVKVVIEDYSSR